MKSSSVSFLFDFRGDLVRVAKDSFKECLLVYESLRRAHRVPLPEWGPGDYRGIMAVPPWRCQETFQQGFVGSRRTVEHLEE